MKILEIDLRHYHLINLFIDVIEDRTIDICHLPFGINEIYLKINYLSKYYKKNVLGYCFWIS